MISSAIVVKKEIPLKLNNSSQQNQAKEVIEIIA